MVHLHSSHLLLPPGMDPDKPQQLEEKKIVFDISKYIYRPGQEDTDSESDDSVISDPPYLSDEEEVQKQVKNTQPTKIKGELDLCDLPPIEELQIAVEESVLQLIGQISSIVDILVVVHSYNGCSNLDVDSVLFLTRLSPLGRIHEIFGPVIRPFYSVRFNTPDEIKDKNLTVGMSVYFAPGHVDISISISVDAIKKLKGSDASWTHNREPPAHCLDYSDDEEEKAAKRKNKNNNKVAITEDGKKCDPVSTEKLQVVRRSSQPQSDVNMNRPHQSSGYSTPPIVSRDSRFPKHEYGQQHSRSSQRTTNNFPRNFAASSPNPNGETQFSRPRLQDFHQGCFELRNPQRRNWTLPHQQNSFSQLSARPETPYVLDTHTRLPLQQTANLYYDNKPVFTNSNQLSSTALPPAFSTQVPPVPPAVSSHNPPFFASSPEAVLARPPYGPASAASPLAYPTNMMPPQHPIPMDITHRPLFPPSAHGHAMSTTHQPSEANLYGKPVTPMSAQGPYIATTVLSPHTVQPSSYFIPVPVTENQASANSAQPIPSQDRRFAEHQFGPQQFHNNPESTDNFSQNFDQVPMDLEDPQRYNWASPHQQNDFYQQSARPETNYMLNSQARSSSQQTTYLYSDSKPIFTNSNQHSSTMLPPVWSSVEGFSTHVPTPPTGSHHNTAYFPSVQQVVQPIPPYRPVITSHPLVFSNAVIPLSQQPIPMDTTHRPVFPPSAYKLSMPAPHIPLQTNLYRIPDTPMNPQGYHIAASLMPRHSFVPRPYFT